MATATLAMGQSAADASAPPEPRDRDYLRLVDDDPARNGTRNPWDCYGKSDYPHGSSSNPGNGYVNAKSHIFCAETPPNHTEQITITLYHFENNQWYFEKVAYGACPSGTGSHNRPTCRYHYTTNMGWLMELVLSQKCEEGTTSPYKQVAHHFLWSGDSLYSATTGNENPNVYCRPRP